MLEKYPKEVRLVHKYIPIHEFTRQAAKAALAAGEQGKFWEFHDKVYENQEELRFNETRGGLNEAKLLEIAGLLKLDMKRFVAKMADPAFEELVDHDLNEARDLAIPVTPQVYVNGMVLKKLSFQGLIVAIDNELKR